MLKSSFSLRTLKIIKNISLKNVVPKRVSFSLTLRVCNSSAYPLNLADIMQNVMCTMHQASGEGGNRKVIFDDKGGRGVQDKVMDGPKLNEVIKGQPISVICTFSCIQ